MFHSTLAHHDRGWGPPHHNIRLRGVHILQDIWDIVFGFFMTEEAKINFLFTNLDLHLLSSISRKTQAQISNDATDWTLFRRCMR